MKFTLMSIVLVLSLGCQKSNPPEEEIVPEILNTPKAEILISDISSDKCLNLEKLMQQLDSPQFSFPAAVMHTDFKTITNIPLHKSHYFAFSTFYYKQRKANELALFNQVKQNACDTLEIQSASREPILFKIIENSELHIRFQLVGMAQESLQKKQKEAFLERIQPFEYTVIYASKNKLKIIEKYKSVDPLCESKNTIKLEVTKSITWAQTEAELPSRYQINSTYYADVRSAALTDAIDSLPVLDSVGTLSVDEIRHMMSLPIRNELKYCN